MGIGHAVCFQWAWWGVSRWFSWGEVNGACNEVLCQVDGLDWPFEVGVLLKGNATLFLFDMSGYMGILVSIHSQMSGMNRQSVGARCMVSSGLRRKRHVRYVPVVLAAWMSVSFQTTCTSCHVGGVEVASSHGVGGAATKNSCCLDLAVSL